MTKLSEDVRSRLRTFAFFIVNGTLCGDVIPYDMDYAAILEDPSALEMTFAIWSNVLELDENGNTTNESHATRRAAQFVRGFVDPDFVVEPPFAASELELT